MGKKLGNCWRCILVCLVLLTSNAVAARVIDAVAIAGGWGRPAGLTGVRMSVQHDWSCGAGELSPIKGYWALSIAHWQTSGDRCGDYRTVNILAIAPVVRFTLYQRDLARPRSTPTPYAEISIGLAALSRNQLSSRRLGEYWEFQDMIGVGLRFGWAQQYDLAYHYLHYSNANLCHGGNSGIDVKKLLTFSYHFTGV